MIAAGAFAVLGLGAVGIGLARFVGCEGYGPGYGIMALAFHYDPDLVIEGSRVTIQRVDFVLHSHGSPGRGEDDLRLGLIAGGGVVTNGKELQPGVDIGGLVQAEPAQGLYRAMVEGSTYNGGWVSARCEAFAAPSDSEPVFPSSTTSPEEIEIRTGQTVRFDFTLTQTAAGWVVAPE